MKRKMQTWVGMSVLSACLVMVAFPASAYDENKCKANVKKALNIIKKFRTLKINELYKKLDELDNSEAGVEPSEMNEFMELAPFDDLNEMKKLDKFLAQVEENCVKEEEE